MLNNRVLLKVLSDMKGITGAKVSLWNIDGTCISSTDDITDMQKNVVQEYALVEMEEMEESVQKDGNYLRPIYREETPQYILCFEELEGDAEVIGALCASQIENVIAAYKEPMNKSGFLKQLILGDMDVDVAMSKAERVRIGKYEKRVVFVIEPKKEEEEIVTQTLKSLYVTGVTDFVVEIDKNHIAFIKSVSSTETEKDIYHTAETIADTLSAETMVYVRVGYGTVVEDIGGIRKSYEEAGIALEVGRSFYADRMVLAYKELGIGRLIHQLPDRLCEEFLEEVLCGNGLAQFDEETMLAANQFFENNLNISETARQLYIHRNTLMYRLEKIQKKTGLDVRLFEDAMTFRLALMVSNQVNFNRVKG